MKHFKNLVIITIGIINFTFLSCMTENSSNKNKKAQIIWDKYENGNAKIIHQFLTDTANLDDEYYYMEFYENGNLKLHGLEKQEVRKKEWNYYFENGKLRAKVNFKNDTLNGLITIYASNGQIEAKDSIQNNVLQSKNSKIIYFIMEELNCSGQRAVWIDSLNITIDSLKKL